MNKRMKRKQILSVIGSTATHSIIGSMFYYFNFIKYRYSYLKRIDNSITKPMFNLIIPLAIALMYIASWLGAYIEKKTSPPIAVFIGNVLVLSSTGFLFLSTNITLDYLLLSLYGIGIGINYLTSLKCLFYLFPNEYHHGLIIGTSMSGFGLSALFCYMTSLIINPNFVRPHINFAGDGDFIYPLYISKRISLFQIIFISMLSLLSFLSVLCLSRYDQEKNYVIFDIPINISNNQSIEPVMKLDLFSVSDGHGTFVSDYLLKRETFAFIILEFLSNILIFLCLFSYSDYGFHYRTNSNIMIWCSIGFVALSGIGRFILGVVYSHSQYKVLMYLLLIAQLISGIGFYFSAQLSWFYIVPISIIGFTYGGISVISLLYISKIFGYNKSIEVYGFMGIGNGLSCIVSALILIMLSNQIANYAIRYLVINLIGDICTIIAGIIVYVMDDSTVNTDITEQ